MTLERIRQAVTVAYESLPIDFSTLSLRGEWHCDTQHAFYFEVMFHGKMLYVNVFEWIGFFNIVEVSLTFEEIPACKWGFYGQMSNSEILLDHVELHSDLSVKTSGKLTTHDLYSMLLLGVQPTVG
jgi:hypothetical protein